MKMKFFVMCVLICASCFGLALGVFFWVPGMNQKQEPVVYRNGEPVKEELFLADETILSQTQKEQSKIAIEIDTTKQPEPVEEQENPDYNWYATTLYVEDLVPGVEYVVVLEYLNLKSTVLEALLYEPDFSKSYSKDELSRDGTIVFSLPQGSEGTYTIVLYGTGDIGGFTTYTVKKEAFMNLQKPNVEYPRDLMREDALIDK